MPKYLVELHDGRKFQVEADSQPTEQEVLAALDTHDVPTPASSGMSARTGVQQPGIIDRLTSPTALATAAAGIGTLGTGGLMAIPAAGLYGAAGAGTGALIQQARSGNKESLDVPQTLGMMAGQGAAQAGGEALGYGASAGLKALAPRLMQSMLKPSKAILDESPTVAADAVRAGVPVGQGGLIKVGKLIDKNAQKVTDKLALAERAGAPPINMADVVGELKGVSQKIAQEPLSAAKLNQLSEIGAQAVKENPHPIPLTDAQPMKQAAQRVAREGYRKVAAGADVNSVGPDANMAIARGLRKEIEKRANVADLNAETQKLIGVRKAVSGANRRIANNQVAGMNDLIATVIGGGGYGLAGPPGLGAGLTYKALTTPAVASRLAIAMDRLAPMASHSPNAARAALLAALAAPQ